MTRNRAERRHHMVRLKKIRCRYRTAGDGSKKASGICFRTPCICSCWMCGIDAIIMVPAYRKFVQKHAMRIKGK